MSSDRPSRPRHLGNNREKRLRDLSTSSEDSFSRSMRHNDIFDTPGIDIVRKNQRDADAAKAAAIRAPKALDANASDSDDMKQFKKLSRDVAEEAKKQPARREARANPIKKTKTTSASASTGKAPRVETPTRRDAASDGTIEGMAKLNLSGNPRDNRNEERSDARRTAASGSGSGSGSGSKAEPSGTGNNNANENLGHKGPCFRLLSGKHYSLEEYSSSGSDGKKQKKYHYICLVGKCKSRRVCKDRLVDIEAHIKENHMEPLCGFIGKREDRTEHIRTSKCHEGSDRRINSEKERIRYEAAKKNEKGAAKKKEKEAASTSTGGSK